jgi:predicted DNA-binding transcriptional regulator AlpA
MLAAVTHHLVGAVEIAAMFGVSRQRVNQIAKDDPTFPAPTAYLATGRIWSREAVEKWAKATGRTIVGEK